MDSQALTRVATYERTIGASIERVWENVLDWEHLPWLHRSSFCALERIDSGTWGWRVELGLPPAAAARRVSLELLVDRERSRYVTRTTAGVGAGTEIWTRLTPKGEHCTDIEVGFDLPGVPPDKAEALGKAYTTLYTQLWDEDEAMMIRRTEQLARAAQRSGGARKLELELGTLDAVRVRAPFDVSLGGGTFRVLEIDGVLRVHSTVCPHSLGPLEDSVEDGRLTCPWHGYQFDVATGRSCDDRNLHLRPARLEVDPASTEVTLTTR